MGPQLYETLTDVFDAIRASGRLVNVPHAFGRRDAKPLTSLPRVVWRPTSDGFREGELQNLELVQPDPTGANRQIQTEEHTARMGGVAIDCYAATSTEAERLACGRVLGAFADVLRATTNYTVQGGELTDPEDLEERSWRFTLRIQIRLVCADVLTAHKPTATQGSVRTLP